MKTEKFSYKVTINHPFRLPGQPKKREPVAYTKTKSEADIIAFRLNGRSRVEPLYAVEKVVA